jgi:hypothetical protein
MWVILLLCQYLDYIASNGGVTGALKILGRKQSWHLLGSNEEFNGKPPSYY